MANGVDILGRQSQVIGRAYSADSFRIAIAGQDQGFMLVQNLQYGYQQNVTRVFDLENSEFQAYFAARPQGQMTINNIVTDMANMISFTQLYGDVCSADTSKNMLVSIERRADGTLCQQEGGTLVFTQPVLVSATGGIATADYMITSTMAFLFASLVPGGAIGGS